MGMLSILVGGGMGVGTHLFSNAIQKVPLSRKPWMHVITFTVGCVIGSKYPKWEKSLVEDINEIRAAKGMSPMVGTNAWIRYRPPEGDDVSAK